MAERCRTKIISIMLAIMLVIPMFTAGKDYYRGNTETVYAAEEDKNVAYAVLTDDFKSQNFAEVRMGTNDKIKYFSRGGSKTWFMDNTSKQESSFMYFNLSDNFANKITDGTVFDIEFEYYSQNNGFFRIIYDSQRKEAKNGDVVYVGDEKNWQKTTITIDDAYFDNRVLDKYDFILSIQGITGENVFSAASIAIRNVKVTKHTAKNPITNYCSIEEVGNVYSDYEDEKIIYNNLKNTTDRELTAELKSTAVTIGGEVKWEGSTTVTLAPYEEKAVPVNIETKWCDLYDYRSELVGEGFVSEFKPHRFAIVKTDPDGIRNERYYINIHPERYLDTAGQMGDVLAKMNCQGVRFVFTWKMVQWNVAWGAPAYPEAYKTVHQALTDSGIKFLCCLDDQFPTGALSPYLEENVAAREEWKNAVELIMNSLPKDTVYEITNEPMWAHCIYGDSGDATPENLARLTEGTVERIHKVNPEAKAGVWSVCSLPYNRVFEDYFTPGMESEYNMCEDADAFAMHPYTQMPIERTNMLDTIMMYIDSFKKRGKEDVEIWYTETGYNPYDKNIGSEENRGAFNSRLFTYLTAEDINDIFAVYNFEQKGIIMTNRENRFGMVSTGYADAADIYGSNYVPTESYVTAAAQNYVMAQITPDGDFSNDNTMAYRFDSEKFGGKVFTMWGKDYDDVVKVDLGTNHIRYFDVNGNETELTSEDGVYTFEITHQPFYVLGDIRKTEITDVPDFELSNNEYVVIPDDIIDVDVKQNIDGEYTFDVETPEYMKLREKTEFTEGKANIKIDVLSVFDENAYVYVNIKDKSGKLMQQLKVRCKTAEKAISSTLLAVPAGENNTNRWKVKITVKNESNTHLKRGYIKFNSPDKFAKLPSVDIGPLPPQKTAEVEINCPEIVEKGMYDLNYDVVLDDDVSHNFSKTAYFIISAKADSENPIVIDGDINVGEWDKTTVIHMNSGDQVVGYEDWDGKTDLSGYYIVSWDEEKFYFCAEITDNVHYQNETIRNMENGDSVTFGIYDPRDAHIVSGQGNVDYHGIVLGLTPEGPKAYRNKSQVASVLPAGDLTGQYELAIKRTGIKTCYEFSIPWKDFLSYEYTPTPEKAIYFSSIISENDGKGRRGQMQFAGGLGWQANVDLFAMMKFVDVN